MAGWFKSSDKKPAIGECILLYIKSYKNNTFQEKVKSMICVGFYSNNGIYFINTYNGMPILAENDVTKVIAWCKIPCIQPNAFKWTPN
jgi:hypothetical protein